MSDDYTFAPSMAEKSYYDLLWMTANPSGGSDLGGAAAVAFFKRSGIDTGILKQIWGYSTNGATLNINQFYSALRYIVMVQSGDFPINRERLCSNANIDLGLPKFKDIPLPTIAPIKFAPAITTGNNTVMSNDNYSISEEEYKKYLDLFKQYDVDHDGYLNGQESVGIFTKSGLNKDILGTIWQFADNDKDGKLTPREFCVAFHLIICVSKKGYTLPNELPKSLKLFIENGVSPSSVLSKLIPMSESVGNKFQATTEFVKQSIDIPQSIDTKSSIQNSTVTIASDSLPNNAVATKNVDNNLSLISSAIGKKESELNKETHDLHENRQKMATIQHNAVDLSNSIAKSFQIVIEKLKQEKIAMNALVAEVEESNKEANSKVENVVNEINSLQQNLSELRSQLDIARKQQATFSESYSKILLEKQSVLSQIDSTRNQIDLLISNVGLKHNELRETDIERASLSSRYQDSTVDRELKEDIVVLNNEVNNLKQLLDSLKTNKSQIGAEVERLNSLLSKSTIELEKDKELMQLKENQIAALKNEKSLLLKEKEELSSLLKLELLQKDKVLKEKDELSNQLTMQKIEKERHEREKLEQEKLEQEKREREKLERQKLEKLKQEKVEKLEQVKREKLEKLEQVNLEQEKLEKLKQEKLEQVKREKLEQEELERQKLEKLKQEKLEQEKREKLEQERLEQEKREKLEQEKREQVEREQAKEESLKQSLLSDVDNFDKHLPNVTENTINSADFGGFDTTSFPASTEGFEPFDNDAADFSADGFDTSAFDSTNFDNNSSDTIQAFTGGFDSFGGDPFVATSSSNFESTAFAGSFDAPKTEDNFGEVDNADSSKGKFVDVNSEIFNAGDTFKKSISFNDNHPSDHSDSFDSPAFKSTEELPNVDPFTSTDSFNNSSSFRNDPFSAPENAPSQNQMNTDVSFDTFNVNSFGDDPFGPNVTKSNNDSFTVDSYDPFTTGTSATDSNIGFDDFGSTSIGNPFGDFASSNNASTDNDGFSSPW